MTNLSNITGKTEKEIKAIYLSAIDTMLALGFSKTEARKIARETFKETIGLI